MKLLFLLPFFLFLTSEATSQTPVDYPEGLYEDKENFSNRIPSNNLLIELDLSDSNATELIGRGFFRYKETGKKVKNVFAICYEGELYFQTGHIILPRNRNKKDKDQTSWTLSAIQEFNRVIFITSRFAYLEVLLKSGWETALAANVGGTVYGYKKSVVWDYENQEFNILRNCKDHNDFMNMYNPSGTQTCSGKSYDSNATRESIKQIE